jgi:hypothetical protein
VDLKRDWTTIIIIGSLLITPVSLKISNKPKRSRTIKRTLNATSSDKMMSPPIDDQQQHPVLDDNSKRRYLGTVLLQALADYFTIWLGKSPMPLWVHCWLVLFVISVLSSVAFLPHPYAITNVVGMVVILMLNGREIVRIRGVNKNMGGPHLVAWIPVLVVDAMTLFSSKIDGNN